MKLQGIFVPTITPTGRDGALNSEIQTRKLEESRKTMKFEIAKILNELGVENE